MTPIHALPQRYLILHHDSKSGQYPKLIRLLLVTCLCLFLSPCAFAQSLSPGCSAAPATPPISFGSTSSIQIKTTQKTTSTTNAGVRCGGSLLTILGASGYIRAVVSSTNASKLVSTTVPADNVPYLIYADPGYARQITLGTAMNYYNASLLNLLGLSGNAYAAIPMYYRTQTGAYNISAGTYTDTITINWSWSICTLVSVGSLCIGPVNSGTSTSTIVLNLTITPDCLVNAPDINFGTAPLITSLNAVTQTISMTCTKNSPYTVALNDGTHASGTQRRLASGSNYINYEIYQGPVSSTRWGSTSGQTRSSAGADVNPGNATGNTAQGFIYRATILSGQPAAPAGVYTDSVILSVTF